VVGTAEVGVPVTEAVGTDELAAAVGAAVLSAVVTNAGVVLGDAAVIPVDVAVSEKSVSIMLSVSVKLRPMPRYALNRISIARKLNKPACHNVGRIFTALEECHVADSMVRVVET